MASYDFREPTRSDSHDLPMQTRTPRVITTALAVIATAIPFTGCNRNSEFTPLDGYVATRTIKAGEMLQESDIERPGVFVPTAEQKDFGFLITEDELPQYLGRPLAKDVESGNFIIETAFSATEAD